MTDGEKLFLGVAAVVGLGALLSRSSGPKARTVTWQEYEEAACRALGKRRLGGPGRHDCEGGGEVKHWRTAVHSGVVQRAYEDRRTSITASGGFTSPARDLARQLGIRLIDRPA